MKAMVLTRFGPPEVLQLQDVPKPTPKDNEVLIRVHATTVTAGDSDLRGLHVPVAFRLPIRLYVSRRRSPFILGQELAGEIEAIGPAVTRFKPGDQVVAWTGFALGAYAEYTCMRETGVLAFKPPSMSYEEAAPLAVGGLEAAYFMTSAKIQPGQKVLIYGAAGSIGTYAIQLARYFDADITAVDSAEKVDALRSLGANHTIDYRKEDFTQRGERYDVIFDVIGKTAFSRSLRALAPHGRYLLGNPGVSQRLQARFAFRSGGKRIIPWASRTPAQYAEEFRFLTTLIQAGKLKTIIDRSFPLEQAAEAHRYVETGRKQGQVVITVG